MATLKIDEICEALGLSEMNEEQQKFLATVVDTYNSQESKIGELTSSVSKLESAKQKAQRVQANRLARLTNDILGATQPEELDVEIDPEDPSSQLKELLASYKRQELESTQSYKATTAELEAKIKAATESAESSNKRATKLEKNLTTLLENLEAAKQAEAARALKDRALPQMSNVNDDMKDIVWDIVKDRVVEKSEGKFYMTDADGEVALVDGKPIGLMDALNDLKGPGELFGRSLPSAFTPPQSQEPRNVSQGMPLAASNEIDFDAEYAKVFGEGK